MNSSSPQRAAPTDWHAEAATLWAAGEQQAAFNALLADLNGYGRNKPSSRVLQLVYYMFQRNDWESAAGVLGLQHADDPANDQILLNLAVCLSRSGRAEEAAKQARAYLQRDSNEPVIWDVLASSLSALQRLDEATEAGTQSLVLKDRLSLAAHPSSGPLPSRPAPGPGDAANPPRDVIAFSLWGARKRYLWGALDNLLAAPALYPGWRVRIYLDDTVPAAWQDQFRAMGGDVRVQAPGQSQRERLCWRFQVANDPGVNHFVVRDIDSVINPRERAAVTDWLASGKRFHVMRDWWTHSDLMMAGMWGGTAGILPPLAAQLAAYRPRAMETPNVDQWFLRDMVWPLLRDDCLVHDRCFRMPGSQPWPLPTPPGVVHVGQDAHGADGKAQAERLGALLERLPPA